MARVYFFYPFGRGVQQGDATLRTGFDFRKKLGHKPAGITQKRNLSDSRPSQSDYQQK
jgi:hypothetical protein